MEFVGHEKSITLNEANSLDFLGQAVKFTNPHTGLKTVTCRIENYDDFGNRVLDRHTYKLK